MKKVLFKKSVDASHWVGDGFLARSIFSYNDGAREFSPFLLMDYLGPVYFPPAQSAHRRGVGEHPHRGFETVSIMYTGQVEHRDSSGGGGVIGPGDVQWMTAGSGVVHSEFHGKEIAKNGGSLHGVQIWVNLPRRDEMTTPKYQGIKSDEIPKVEFSDAAGSLRVIAGNYKGSRGPASTFTPINLWDIELKANKRVELSVPANHSAVVFLAQGAAIVSGDTALGEAETAVLDRKGETFTISSSRDSKLLFLGGEVIDEPVVGYGPFVMNSEQEIVEAIQDFEAGRIGVLEKLNGSD